MLSVMNAAYNPLIGNISNSSVGPLVALARNNLVANFLNRNREEWLWCVDTDIVFAPNTIDQLMKAADPVERPVVSALYYTIMNGAKTATIYQDSPETEGTFDHPKDFPADELIEVGGTGAGCLLIHRSVLRQIYMDAQGDKCWFREMVLNGRDIGEDLSFSIRAREAGYPVHIHTGIQVGHVKPVMWGSVS
jgi:GT2 family glycosyltransferase